jgi:hypothetical protein
MKKIIFITVTLFMVNIVNLKLIDKSNNKVDFNMFLSQSAQAQDSESSSVTDFQSGSEMGSVRYCTGSTTTYVSVGSGTSVPVTTKNYEDINCCVDANNNTACNFGGQDSRC